MTEATPGGAPPATRRVRVRLLVLAGVALAVLLLGAAVLAHLVARLDTPEFKRALLDRASAALGARVQARTMEVSLLEGVTLEGVTVGNPPPLPGTLVAADAFVLRYRLWPLLRGRVELAKLAAEKPVLDLAMDGRGVFNYEKLGGAKATPSLPSAGTLPVDLEITQLSVSGGRITVRDPRTALMKAEGADFKSSVRAAGSSVDAQGTLRVATLNLADTFFVRGLEAPLKASRGILTLDPVRGALGGGDVRGDVVVRFQDGFHFTGRMAVKRAQLQKLLAEARARPTASGLLTADATIEGTGGLATLKGKGQAQVEDCRVNQSALMGLLAAVLRVPELAHPDLDECRATFTLGGGRLVNPSLSLRGPALQLTGHGVTRLDTQAIDYEMTLALGAALVGRIPTPELRAAFKDRGDGFSTVDFKVTGTTSAPHSDLALRVGQAAAESGLKKFLRRKFF